MRRIFVPFAVAWLVFVFAATPLHAQDSKLLPEAQKAFDRGLAAVQKQEWGLAARYFAEAQKLGGYDPRLYLNLALARSNGGQDLHAIAWFNAYLALVPDAPNAPAVRDEIARLKTVARTKIEKILTTTREASKAARLYGEPFLVARAVDVLKGPAAHVTNLIELNDFESAAAAVDAMDDAARNNALVTIVRALLADRYYPYDRAEDARQADRFFQKITDPAARSQVSTPARIAKLNALLDESAEKRDIDLHVVEELLTLQTEPARRNALLHRAARALMAEKKFSAIEPLLRRLETVSKDSNLNIERAEFLAHLALDQLAAGLTAEARATAQRAIALPPSTDKIWAEQMHGPVAAAKAVLGDAKPALAVAKSKAGKIPYQTWVGVPNLVGFYQSGFELLGTPEFLVGAATFALAMNGKVDEALRIAQQFKADASNQVPFTNIAHALLLRGNSTKALDILKTSRTNVGPKVDGSSRNHLQAQAVGLFVLDRAKKGDLKAGEQALQLLPATETWKQLSEAPWQQGLQYRVELLLRLAEAAHRTGNANAVQKYVNDAKKAIADGRSNADLQRAKPGPLNELLERVAITQDRIGDQTGAKATRADKTVPNSPTVNLWLAFIGSYSFDQPSILNPEQRLAVIAKETPTHAPYALAELAWNMARALRRVEILEQQVARTAR